MNDQEIAQANAAVRDQMHSAASAVLHALLRTLHQKTDTRLLLTPPPLDAHRVNYTVLAGDPSDVVAYGEVYGLKNITPDTLEVKSS